MEDDVTDQEDQPSGPDFAVSFFNQVQRFRRLLLQYWWIPLLAVGLSVGIQRWSSKHAPLTFASTARMIVNVKLSLPTASVYLEELNNFFGTQAALMQSETVVQRVRRHLQSARPELHPVPVKLSVTPAPKTSIFDLEAEGEDPDYTQAYLQGIMDEYISLKKDLLANATTATQSVMEEQLKHLSLEVQDCKRELLAYQTSNSVVLLQPAGENSAANRLATLTQKLADKRSDLQMLQTLTLDQNLERLEGIFVPRVVESSPTNTVAKNHPTEATGAAAVPPHAALYDTPANLGPFETGYLQAKQQLLMARAKREALPSTLVPTAGEVVSLSAEIAASQLEMEMFKNQSEEQLKNRQHTLELEIQDTESQVTEWEAKALDVSKKLADFDALKEKYQRLQTQYDQLQANLQTLEVNKGIGQESVTIFEPATPAVFVPPANTKHLIMAGLVGLIVAAAILLLINGLNDCPSSFTELERLFDLPVLGQIPLVKLNRNMPAILQLEDTRYPLVEANRSLRSAVLYKDVLKAGAASQPRSIVITSAGPNDGKSMTAANFAITLAQAGANVLLIDADLRRGGLHQHFKLAEGPGLAEVLARQCAWYEAVSETGIPNLALLPAGISRKFRGGNLFAKAGKILSEISGNYDYIILDTVPVLVADDVLSLAPNADGLILVVRAGFTSGRMAQAALHLLQQRRVNVMGLVFNAIPANASDYHNYRFKDYYPQT